MKYIKTILIWTTAFLIFGFSLKLFLEIETNQILFIFGVMGLIIGVVKAILIIFMSSNKSEIFEQARKTYNGNINLNGETELLINNRKIILDSKVEDLGIRMANYIIAKIDLTDTSVDFRNKYKKKLEIVDLNNRQYSIVYCSWGNKGIEFKKRIETKLLQIESLIDKSIN